MNRRDFLTAGLALAARSAWSQEAATTLALLDDLERRTFNFFWETTNPRNGLVPDRWPTPSFSSIAATGFGLTAYPIGVERGFVTRAQARERTLVTLRFLDTAPQGPEPVGRAGYKGFFYHFLDIGTGLRHDRDVELSTVDTALLLAGALYCQSYFDADDPGEAEIRALAERIYARVEWPWAQVRPPGICHGWKPEVGHMLFDWRGYNEAMLVYLLALGSPSHPVGAEAWTAWTSTYANSWKSMHGQQYLHFAPLFGHQYTHVWIDFRDIRDAYLRERDLDYFENSRRATYAQRAYAIANPMGWADYGPNVWGISACDGPADTRQMYNGELREFRSYAGRGAGGASTYDDGTLAPTAVASSVPFAPEIAIPALEELHRHYGRHIYANYGFLDAFNPSFRYDVKLKHGKRIADMGWVADDYLGIDQGPIVAMLANHRGEVVWRPMRRNPHVRRGLQRAGFGGGWLDRA